MDSKSIWSIFIIFIIIIIIGILFWLFFYNHDINKKENFNNNRDKHNNKIINLSEKIQSLLSQPSTSQQIERGGDLYQSCPCKPGFICDKGICKQKQNSICITSLSCDDSSICYNGRCIEKPKTKNEQLVTNYDRDNICVNRHFLKLENDRFIMMKGWWSMNEGVYLCDSDITGLIYLVKDNNILRLSTNPLITDRIKVNQDLIPLKLFRFQNKIFVLTLEGKIYQLINENIKNKWQYRHVREIYEKDISDLFIEDLYTCSDGSIAFKTDGIIYSYLMEKKEWTSEIGSRKIVFGEFSNTKMVLYDDKIEINLEIEQDDFYDSSDITIKQPIKTPPLTPSFLSNHKKNFLLNIKSKHNNFSGTFINVKFTFPGSYRDIEFNINEDKFLVLTAKTNQIKEFEPLIWKNSVDHNQIEVSFNERSLQGNGDKLIRTNDHIWLLTGAQCSAI